MRFLGSMGRIVAPAITGPGVQLGNASPTLGNSNPLLNPLAQILQQQAMGKDGRLGPIELTPGQGGWQVNGQGGFPWQELLTHMQGAMGGGQQAPGPTSMGGGAQPPVDDGSGQMQTPDMTPMPGGISQVGSVGAPPGGFNPGGGIVGPGGIGGGSPDTYASTVFQNGGITGGRKFNIADVGLAGSNQ